MRFGGKGRAGSGSWMGGEELVMWQGWRHGCCTCHSLGAAAAQHPSCTCLLPARGHQLCPSPLTPSLLALPLLALTCCLQEVTGKTFNPLMEAPEEVKAMNGGKSELFMQIRGSKFVRYQECKVQELPDEVSGFAGHCRGCCCRPAGGVVSWLVLPLLLAGRWVPGCGRWCLPLELSGAWWCYHGSGFCALLYALQAGCHQSLGHSCSAAACAGPACSASIILPSRFPLCCPSLLPRPACLQVPQGSTPRTIVVHLRGTLTRHLKAGDSVTLSGIFLPEPYTGHRALMRASLLNATYVEAMTVRQNKQSYQELVLSEEQRAAIEAMTEEGDIYSRLANSIAPGGCRPCERPG